MGPVQKCQELSFALEQPQKINEVFEIKVLYEAG